MSPPAETHAVCAVARDVPIGPVTVKSCATYNGCAIVHHDIDLTDIGAYLHKSPRLRQSLENYIVITRRADRGSHGTR